jgi:hypothetical protein
MIRTRPMAARLGIVSACLLGSVLAAVACDADTASGTATQGSGAGDPSTGGSGPGGRSGAGGGGGAGGAGGSARCEGGSDTGVTGRVTDGVNGATPLEGVRMTLFDGALTAFWETRTDASGRYDFVGVPPKAYTLGAATPDREYEETRVTVTDGACSAVDIEVGPEMQVGSWATLGDPGEAFGGTNSGVLLPDGRLMYCHDTLDPVVLDPVTGERTFPPGSPRLQGCHAVTVQPDGRSIYVGGHDVGVFGPGTRQVKTFDPATLTWQVHADLNDYRWYPTMVPLPNGELLTIGGGGQNNPVRVKTSEILNPATMTWTPVGDVAIGNEVSPIVLLYTGEALMTHRPPQLYDPGTQSWRLAGDFVQANRMSNGDHADHEMVLMPDGKVVAIGFKTFDPGDVGNIIEIYDPASDSWSLKQNQPPVRSRASILLLPDKKIVVLGGYKEDLGDATPVNPWGQVALADLYDAASDTWRRLAPMSMGREYHAMPILVPDGRVFITGGEGAPGNEPMASVIEAFTPPYLLRGVRPEILDLATTTLKRGDELTFRVAKTNAPTSVILMGTSATTHFMDSGNGRYLELAFTQSGDEISATIPNDPVRSVYGYYTLFVLVDDIPSVGRIVRIVP